MDSEASRTQQRDTEDPSQEKRVKRVSDSPEAKARCTPPHDSQSNQSLAFRWLSDVTRADSAKDVNVSLATAEAPSSSYAPVTSAIGPAAGPALGPSIRPPVGPTTIPASSQSRTLSEAAPQQSSRSQPQQASSTALQAPASSYRHLMQPQQFPADGSQGLPGSQMAPQMSQFGPFLRMPSFDAPPFSQYNPTNVSSAGYMGPAPFAQLMSSLPQDTPVPLSGLPGIAGIGGDSITARGHTPFLAPFGPGGSSGSVGPHVPSHLLYHPAMMSSSAPLPTMLAGVSQPGHTAPTKRKSSKSSKPLSGLSAPSAAALSAAAAAREDLKRMESSAAPTSSQHSRKKTPPSTQRGGAESDAAQDTLKELDRRRHRLARNKLAARTCREKKKRQTDELKQRAAELEQENAALHTKLALAEAELQRYRVAFKGQALPPLSAGVTGGVAAPGTGLSTGNGNGNGDGIGQGYGQFPPPVGQYLGNGPHMYLGNGPTPVPPHPLSSDRHQHVGGDYAPHPLSVPAPQSFNASLGISQIGSAANQLNMLTHSMLRGTSTSSQHLV